MAHSELALDTPVIERYTVMIEENPRGVYDALANETAAGIVAGAYLDWYAGKIDELASVGGNGFDVVLTHYEQQAIHWTAAWTGAIVLGSNEPEPAAPADRLVNVDAIDQVLLEVKQEALEKFNKQVQDARSQGIHNVLVDTTHAMDNYSDSFLARQRKYVNSAERVATAMQDFEQLSLGRPMQRVVIHNIAFVAFGLWQKAANGAAEGQV